MDFASIILIALSGVLFAMMFDKFCDLGMIFERWGMYLRANEKFWLKPLGKCIDCTNIWVIGLMMVLFNFAHGVWAVLFAFSLGNLFLDLLLKYTE